MKDNSYSYVMKRLLFLVVLIAFSTMLRAQGHYLGNKKNISLQELLKQAEVTDYGKNISAEIYQDVKNTYYAVNLSKVPSRYVKIRLLEMSFSNNALVNIYSDINSGYLLFLVNNTLNKKDKQIVGLFENFKEKANKEERLLSAEQLHLWMIQHDKYKKVQ